MSGLSPELLFCKYDLHETLGNARTAAQDAVEQYPAEDLLSQPEDEIVDFLAATRWTEAPILDKDAIAIAEHGEARIDVSRRFEYNVFDRTSPAYVPGERLEVAIPFSGDGNMFYARPSSFTLSPPRAIVREHELRLVYHDVLLDAESLRVRIDRDIAAIEQYVGWIHAMTDVYDKELPGLIRTTVRARKERLLKARNTVAALGLPVRQRKEPDGFSVPVAKKAVVVPRPPAARTAFRPEPVLTDRDYQDALGVLVAMRNTIERLARSTSSLNEEALRDLLLVGLNARFEGAAGGELFNGAGKTDILIRVEDRNAFIGECKFWRGPRSCTEAIEQLLSYTVWRDSKAALLLFIREKDITRIVDKAIEVISKHPRCKRRLDGRDPCEWVFAADADENREIRLALLPFVVPTVAVD
jgi:hypothetical protein